MSETTATEFLEQIMDLLASLRTTYREYHDNAENIDDKIFYTGQLGVLDTVRDLIEWKAEILKVGRRES